METLNGSLVTKRKNCPVCNSKKYHVHFHSKHNDPAFFEFIRLEQFYSKIFYEAYAEGKIAELEYEIAECSDCHFFYLTEVLNNKGMAILYNDWMDQPKLRKHYREMPHSFYEETMLRVIKKHFRNETKVNILDFGAGYGNFCSMAIELGLNTHAFDLSAEKNDHINELGVTIINDLKNYVGFFDFIYVNQVFEHLNNPAEVIKSLQLCLKKHGYLFISVPDCKNMKAILREKGLSQDLFELLSPYQHVNAFTNSTLKLLAKKGGLKPLTMLDFLRIANPTLDLKELIFLSKKVIKNSFYGTGLFFMHQNE